MKRQFIFSVNLAFVLFMGEGFSKDFLNFPAEAASIREVRRTSVEIENPKVNTKTNFEIGTKSDLKVSKSKVDELDEKVIFEICTKQCGDPGIVINQPCFRRCWLYYHRIRK
ncbi:MAG: hypothetical protein IPO72_13025 [Saprospiraceae bacterium]|nr:hypothetical protein [Candidatus Vicinibacter affinis]MBP6173847.1 hypothetical protein [Saprospiraceae bacterium]MBK6573020.1 hypothetical protein [Candidatus Vicinibacter affinis]MBK6822518.1 hypothetical protein [Candidatus Vicinibacter affinis]MBK8640855.1 hypothetical protein [Candidatus Vicinibacter affinis]